MYKLLNKFCTNIYKYRKYYNENDYKKSTDTRDFVIFPLSLPKEMKKPGKSGNLNRG